MTWRVISAGPWALAPPAARAEGRVVHVDHIKSALKSSGIKRLKLEYDEPPSNFAFNLNLRRYTKPKPTDPKTSATQSGDTAGGTWPHVAVDWNRWKAGAYTRPLFGST